MLPITEHIWIHPALLAWGDLLSFFHESGPLGYLTAAVGILLAAMWVARLHFRLLAENSQMRLRLAEAEAHGQVIRDTTNATHEFLTRITHEIRTPMNGIVSFAALALKTDLTGVQREYLDRVLTSAEWLMHVISDVLDFTRMESSRFDLDCKAFSFANCLLSAVKMVEASAQHKHLELTYRVDPRIPAVLNGDPNRLRQILVNLLENAIRYTTSGSVVLSANVASECYQTLTLSVSVADTGIGIRPEDQARIFEPFRLSSNAHGEDRNGTGLGLSICKRLIEMMGGSLELQSQIGAGSTFRFTAVFQKLLSEEESVETSLVKSKLSLKRLSVLLADDKVVSRRLVTKLLESAGHQVSPAATAGQALTLFSTEIFDLVLISTDLPDMRALSLAQSLRKLEDDASHTHLVVLRAQEDEVDPSSYTSAGLDGVVPKPVQVEQLLRVATEACHATTALEQTR